MLEVFGSGEGVEEAKSLRCKDFSIISRKASISSLCFICIAPLAVVTADVIALAINYSIAGFIEL